MYQSPKGHLRLGGDEQTLRRIETNKFFSAFLKALGEKIIVKNVLKNVQATLTTSAFANQCS